MKHLLILFICLPLLAESKPPKWKRLFKKHREARYNRYDKDGLIKSSTPLYLDKKKSRKVKPTL